MTDDKLREMAIELADMITEIAADSTLGYAFSRDTSDEIFGLLRKVRDLSKPQWLPIEQAPKYVPFIACWKTGSISDCLCTGNADPLRKWKNLRGEYLLPPTHFQPYQEPPK